MEHITWDDFDKVELRVGKIVEADTFKEARRPAYILHVDFGEEIGVLKSSAQITELYELDELGREDGGWCRQFSSQADRADHVRVFGYRISIRPGGGALRAG